MERTDRSYAVPSLKEALERTYGPKKERPAKTRAAPRRRVCGHAATTRARRAKKWTEIQ